MIELIKALERIKSEAVSLADAQVIALEALRAAILALRPAVEPMTDEVRRSYQCLLAMNTPHGFGDRIGPFVKWLQDSGITAKAEGAKP